MGLCVRAFGLRKRFGLGIGTFGVPGRDDHGGPSFGEC